MLPEEQPRASEDSEGRAQPETQLSAERGPRDVRELDAASVTALSDDAGTIEPIRTAL